MEGGVGYILAVVNEAVKRSVRLDSSIGSSSKPVGRLRNAVGEVTRLSRGLSALSSAFLPSKTSAESFESVLFLVSSDSYFLGELSSSFVVLARF